MMMSRSVAALSLLLVAAACNQPDPATRTEEGLYGASSGDNPNLADLQTDQQPSGDTAEGDPATPGENAYPSQTGQPGEPSTGAEGGRSSAETGATGN
jgi:hypothetical protein